MWFRKDKAEVVEAPPAPAVEEPKKVRFAGIRKAAGATGSALKTAACATGRTGAKVAGATGRTVANVASDANTAVTTYRCARLARALKRNEALAATAKETLD